MRQVSVTRYVTPLKEGGSLPAIVEADDDGLYVLKFRGARQGERALVAELIGGGIARALGLRMPEIVLVDVDPALASTEPDAEIQDLIRASAGINLGLDYLPGSLSFDPVVADPDPDLASRIVWLDAYLCNVDRTARNTNLLTWHGDTWLIDHGAALYFHHGDAPFETRVADPFPLIRDHVLLPCATSLASVAPKLTERLDADLIQAILAEIPDAWLQHPAYADAAGTRAGYVEFLIRRLDAPQAFVQEALDAIPAPV